MQSSAPIPSNSVAEIEVDVSEMQEGGSAQIVFHRELFSTQDYSDRPGDMSISLIYDSTANAEWAQ